jgi:hypothetical protein
MEVKRNPYIPEPFVRTITLADGSKLEGSGSLTPNQSVLWIWIQYDKYPFDEIVSIFMDSQKLETITIDFSPLTSQTYTGYCRLDTIRRDVEGNEIRIGLRKN